MEPYQELEARWAEWCGMPHVVACASGTAALHLALEALQLEQGDTVVIPEFTMVACARACTMAGLRPYPLDCRRDLLINTDLLGYRPPGRHVKAIMPVHVYGRRCDMESIALWARQHEVLIVEDLAEGHGIKPHPDSMAACWSLYKNKIIHAEEGGIIAFKRWEHAELARSLRSLGFTEEHNFSHRPRGVSARISNAQAQLALSSLDRAQHNLAMRRGIEETYDSLMPNDWKHPWQRHVVWVYDVRIPEIKSLDRVVQLLNERGIAARHGFKPISMQGEYEGKYQNLEAYKASQEVLYLPVYPNMTNSQISYNVQVLQAAVETVGCRLSHPLRIGSGN